MADIRELQPEELSGVSGGAGSDSGSLKMQSKYKELERAWADLGFRDHGYTRHALDAACDDWARAGFTPSAEEFLEGRKTW